MRIDEFEFQDKNGNEIEPTKDQLVIYIKSLHEQIKNLKIDLKDYMELEEHISTKYDNVIKQFKDFKQAQKQLAISKLEKLRDSIDHNIEIENDIAALKFQEFCDNQIKELNGEVK